MIPRFEIHLDASIPHGENAPEPEDLTRLLNAFESELEALGATVTIQQARTNRKERPQQRDPLAAVHAAISSREDSDSAGYL